MSVWLNVARRHLGVAETPGKDTTPAIRRWLIELGAWWADDETPWCGVFCASVMRECGMPVPKAWYRAKAWLLWGIPIDEPVEGCIVVFGREGGGHVGFVVGRDHRGNLMVLGGNQGNRVSIAPFNPSRVLGYRWPEGSFQRKPLATLASTGPLSTNEA